ncbi:MAG: DNA alkylation repair protein [Phyllobacteriaceae bacterium]|nr:DNA alkylation repair protein [Phyllobacteriaceae bacterium]
MDRNATVADIFAWLEARRSEKNIAGMARYGIATMKAFGVSNAELRPLARLIGRDHDRALALWETGWREARLLAAFTDEKKKVTAAQARNWAAEFDSWEIVDGVTDLFVDAGLADELVPEFAADDREFVRRAAFAMICWVAVHLKKRPDADVICFLPLIEAHARDPRNFVRKAVNWALRSIGKRSMACHGPALALAEKLSRSPDKTARWIGTDAVRELTAGKTLDRLAGRRSA